jgi:hypothetical protein
MCHIGRGGALEAGYRAQQAKELVEKTLIAIVIVHRNVLVTPEVEFEREAENNGIEV